MNEIFSQLQLIFNALLLAGLLWVWAQARRQRRAPLPVPQSAPPVQAPPVQSIGFEQMLLAEEAVRRLNEALQTADARLRSLQAYSSEVPESAGNAYGAVRALHRRGFDARSIAEELHMAQAEVRLVLSVKNPSDGEPNSSS